MAAITPVPDIIKSDNALKKSKKNTPDSEYEAIQQFEEICHSATTTEEIKITSWQHLGCSYFKIKNYHAAIFAFDKTIQSPIKCRETVYAHLYKGDALLKIRRYRQAREEFFTALNILSELPKTITDADKSYLMASALHQIGISLSQSDDDEEAIDYFNQAFFLAKEKIDEKNDVDPNGISLKIEKIFHTARISKSLSLCRTGRLEEAQKLIRTTISDLEGPHQDPYKKYRIGAQNVLGIIYLSDTEGEGTGSEALDAFSKAIEIARSLDEDKQRLYLWKGYYNKGLALKNAQKFTEAIACFTEGLKESGEFEPHLLFARGITKIELQKFEDGMQDLQEVNQFDPRYSPALIAMGDAYRRQSVYYREVELQKQLLESTTEAVSTTQMNLKELSDEMRTSLRHVSWMFYFLFFTGVGAFLYFLIVTLLRYPSAVDPVNTAIGAIGGIDVILSMMLLSPTKVQKNRIDYSQWLMGYFNWINTQFAASTVMLERLQRVHSPSGTSTEEFNWDFAQPVYSFLNVMTKDTLETIDKCCEFPDVQYSLSKKTESKTSDTQSKDGQTKETEKTSTTAKDDSGKTSSDTSAKEVKNVSTEKTAKTSTEIEKPTLPEGFEFITTGDKAMPGHTITGADVSRGIPAIVYSCWRGAATDNRYISLAHLQAGSVFESGSKPEPLSKPFTVDEFSTKDLNLLFSLSGTGQPSSRSASGSCIWMNTVTFPLCLTVLIILR